MIVKLDILQTQTLTIAAIDLYSNDPLQVGAGEEYQFYCDWHQAWKDAWITTTPDGYFNVLGWLIGMRVKHTKCFCLCGVYDEDDSTGFAIGSDKTIITQQTGLISFFANDVMGHYANNSGSIQLEITRLK